jgi:hypothetical protein
MCELNPKHSAFFDLEAFTSDPDMTEDEFRKQIAQKLFNVEVELNKDGQFRFHIHSK